MISGDGRGSRRVADRAHLLTGAILAYIRVADRVGGGPVEPVEGPGSRERKAPDLGSRRLRDCGSSRRRERRSPDSETRRPIVLPGPCHRGALARATRTARAGRDHRAWVIAGPSLGVRASPRLSSDLSPEHHSCRPRFRLAKRGGRSWSPSPCSHCEAGGGFARAGAGCGDWGEPKAKGLLNEEARAQLFFLFLFVEADQTTQPG